MNFNYPETAPAGSRNVIHLSHQTWRSLCSHVDALFNVGCNLWDRYKSGTAPVVANYIEFGLPPELIKILRTTDAKPDQALLRVDYLLSTDGFKLLEAAQNPWGLFAYQRMVANTNEAGIAAFPTDQIYLDLLQLHQGKSIGLWPGFSYKADEQLLLQLAEQHGLTLNWVGSKADLNQFDALLFDTDTAWYAQSLDVLTTFSGSFVPNIANLLFKHKSFLALVHHIANGEIAIPANRQLLQKHLVPAQLITTETDQKQLNASSGVIKDVLGLGSRQVSILDPNFLNETGKLARRRRHEYRKHLRSSVCQSNAIYQDYIQPVCYANTDLQVEVSVVCHGEKRYPFGRLNSQSRGFRGDDAGWALVKIV